MQILKVDKNSRTKELISILVEVWESSVRASHSFLSAKEIENIK